MNPDPSESYLFLFIKTDEFNTKVEISTPFIPKNIGEVLVEPKTQDRGQCINPALLAPKPPSQLQGSSPMGGGEQREPSSTRVEDLRKKFDTTGRTKAKHPSTIPVHTSR